MVLAKQTHEHLLAHHRDFERFAQAMVDSHNGRFDPVFWAFVERYAPLQPSRVVDLGTGPGLLLTDLAERFPQAEVVGVDGQPEMIARAREVEAAREQVKLVEHDLASGKPLPLDDGVADMVVASVLLHELQVPTLALDEAARIIRPGGVLFVYDWVRRPLKDYFGGERPTTLDDFTHFSEHCRYTADDLAWLMDASGFAGLEWLARKDGRFALFAAQRRDDGADGGSS